MIEGVRSTACVEALSMGELAAPSFATRLLMRNSVRRWLGSRGVAGRRETTVEIEGSADERQVRERLGEVAEVLGLRAQLLAV